MEQEATHRYHSMGDHDLLVEIATKVEAMEEHNKEQNGEIASLNRASLRMEGAISLGKWVIGTMLGVLTIAVAVSSFVLAYAAG